MAVSRQKKKKTKQPPSPAARTWKRIAWVVLGGFWLFAVTSLLGFNVADWPSHAVTPQNQPVVNWCGPAGAWLAYHAYFMLGPGVWVIAAAAGTYLAVTLLGKPVKDLPLRMIGAVLMALAVSGFVAIGAPSSSAMPEGAGGLLAIFLTGKLIASFSQVGTMLVLLGLLGVGAVVAWEEAVMAMPHLLAAGGSKLGSLRVPRPVLVGANPLRWLRRAGRSSGILLRPRPVPIRHSRPTAGHPDEPIDEDLADAGPDALDDEADASVDDSEVGESPSAARTSFLPLDPAALREKIRKLPISIASARKPAAAPPPPPQDLSGYQFPPMDLLDDSTSNFTEEMSRIVREQAEVLERSLNTYKIEAEVVAIDAGPVITLYEVQLAPGTKVSQINAISSDIARALKAQNIRVVPNTAGKSTVGIEVPNLKKEIVRLKDLMALGGADIRKTMRLPMYMGKDASGNPLIADLADMPHMLIAGTTGSGKSVCINSIIMSFLFHRRPDELKLVLVDPKMVEMAQFKAIPHLMCPVVTEMNRATAILEWAVTKMDERYALLAEAGVRDIDSYNALSRQELLDLFDPATPEEEARIPKKVYRMVFIVDELADLMITNKEVEGHIVRIAQKARAVGIHLILATQRPQANVVTGLIKSNMPCRVSFQVASGMDSRIVLDSKGAELLLGHGDMLFLTPRSSKLTRAQGTFVADKEIRKTVRFLKEIAEPSFEPQIMQLKEPGATGDADESRDPLFDQAVEIVLETKRGSVSLLQRRLTIGYSRASRLIEEMADAGIIGDYKGSQAREVMISLEEWQALKAQAAQMADDELELGEDVDESDDDEQAEGEEEYEYIDEDEEDEDEDEDEEEYEEEEEEEEE